jgi:Protein of unknown function (DUF3500)
MTLQRLLLVGTVLAALAGAAFVAQESETSGSRMVSAAEKFLGGLNEEQKAKAAIAFDSKERTNWFFIPLQDKNKKSTRKGLPLEEMTDKQKDAAKQLIRAGTSAAGFDKATTIMSLEAILHEFDKTSGNVRNPDWYFFTVFGTPSKTGTWGWRVEGHHLALNFTLDRGQVVSATPFFFGANPAEVKTGDRKGLRILSEAEELAQQLMAGLDEEQRKAAFQNKQFPEIEQGKPKPNVGPPVGLTFGKMNEKQRDILIKLLESYANRMAPDLAKAEMDKIRTAGLDKIHFAFAREEDKPGKPYTYRVQGPTFVIEFLNVQEDSQKNPANHIHSALRNIKGDFGLKD